ncbi:hypothetical protein AB4142_31130, partial [Variovorax sp. 2RAF20]
LAPLPPDLQLEGLGDEVFLEAGVFGMVNPGKRVGKNKQEGLIQADSVPAPLRHPKDALTAAWRAHLRLCPPAASALSPRGTTRAIFSEM